MDSKYNGMKKILVLAVIFSFIIIACMRGNKSGSEDVNEAELLNSAQTLFQPISSVKYDKPDPAMVELGNICILIHDCPELEISAAIPATI